MYKQRFLTLSIIKYKCWDVLNLLNKFSALADQDKEPSVEFKYGGNITKPTSMGRAVFLSSHDYCMLEC